MEKIDSLSIRERGIIMIGIVFVMFILWDSYFMRPQVVVEKRVLADLQVKRAEQGALNVKFQQLVRKEQGGADSLNRKKLAELQQQLAAIEADVRQSTNHLVSPAKMAAILQTILNKSAGLELTEIKGLGASPLLTQTPSETSTVSGGAGTEPGTAAGLNNAYKHGLVIKFEGDYLSTLKYMRQLESLEWGFFWENLEYEVVNYPKGRVAITLYTLSLEKDWIGV